MVDPLLQARSVTHLYDSSRVPTLDNLDFTLEAGMSVGIRGRSGVGKTTLLEILGTMREPSQGDVRYHGESVYDLKVRDRADLRGRYLGFIFQEGVLLPDLTLWENCRLAVELSPREWSMKRTRDRFRTLMEQLGLDPTRKDHLPGQLSTGERQRLAVVRALMHEPRIIMADEPTGNLDSRTSTQFMDLLLPFADESGTALLIASHDRNLTGSLSTVFELEGGKLKSSEV